MANDGVVPLFKEDLQRVCSKCCSYAGCCVAAVFGLTLLTVIHVSFISAGNG